MFPLARTADVIVMECDDELLVYDLIRHRAHRLNATAAAVWRASDGRHSVNDIATQLAGSADGPTAADIVQFALQRLQRAQLMAGEPVNAQAELRLTRRELVRRVAAAGLTTIALPVVATLVAPTALSAQGSGGGTGAPCTTNSQCLSNLCVLGKCV